MGLNSSIMVSAISQSKGKETFTNSCGSCLSRSSGETRGTRLGSSFLILATESTSPWQSKVYPRAKRCRLIKSRVSRTVYLCLGVEIQIVAGQFLPIQTHFRISASHSSTGCQGCPLKLKRTFPSLSGRTFNSSGSGGLGGLSGRVMGLGFPVCRYRPVFPAGHPVFPAVHPACPALRPVCPADRLVFPAAHPACPALRPASRRLQAFEARLWRHLLMHWNRIPRFWL